MTNKRKLWQVFGIGPIGVVVTIIILCIFYFGGIFLQIPQMVIHSMLRLTLLTIFIIDALYLIIGGNYYLRKSGRGEQIAKEGPYQFIRHPIYSAWIFSFTGILAIVFYSWSLIVAVIPLTFIWSWLVQHEESSMIEKFGNEYVEYMDNTGQFLPSWQAIKDRAGE